jgi:methyltransferase (TIGR00027 family)
VAFARGLARHEWPPIAEDPVAADLLAAPWSTVIRAADAMPGAAKVLLKAGDVLSQGRSRFMSYRTRVIDDAVREALGGGIEQLVILGAGLDARAWRMGEDIGNTVVFEVDHPDTQQYKRERIGERAPHAKEVRFVSVDFNKDSVAERLAESGFDVARPAAVIWEGVVMYLPSEAVDATLATLRRLLAPDSRVIISYSRRGDWFQAKEREIVGLVVRAAGEHFTLHEEPEQMAERLARAGFRVRADEGHPDWAPRLLGREQSWNLQRVVCAEPAGDARQAGVPAGDERQAGVPAGDGSGE